MLQFSRTSGCYRLARIGYAFAASVLFAPMLCAQLVPRRVAVVKFELGEQAKQVAHQSLGIQGDAGVDIANELVTELGGSGKVVLIERGELDRVMKEANMPLDEHFDPADAVKLGKLSGAQSVLLGSVTSLSGGVHTTALGSITCRLTPTKCVDQTKGEVATTISVRVVDVETGVIRTTATGEGKAAETKTFASGNRDVEYGNHLLQAATKQALAEVVTHLESSPALAPVTPAAPRTDYSGEIVDVSGDTIIFMAGKAKGAKVGDVVEVRHGVRMIRNSKGEVVKTITDNLGTAKITDVDEKTATATFTASGPAKPRNNDTAVFKP